MFESLHAPAADPIFAVNASFHADPSPRKLDLCVGVYRDDSGATPAMGAVREAEIVLAHRAGSKAYLGLSGNDAFNTAISDLVLGGLDAAGNLTTIQTVAGTGALRILFELARMANPESTIWVSDPAYANHAPIAEAVRLSVAGYKYLDASGKADPGLVADQLRHARRGDVILLQASGHNPSGADMSLELWRSLTQIINETGAVPLVDAAYLGLGGSLSEDAAGLRYMASRVETMMIAVSCSKTFGLYRDRTGAAMVLGARPAVTRLALQQIARSLYSMPPDHGAAAVAEILGSADLFQSWNDELAAMRQRIRSNRENLATALRITTQTDRYDRIQEHKGMFSMLPLTRAQMIQLRTAHSIYGADDGRVNIAGIQTHEIPRIAGSIRQVTQLQHSGE